MSIPTIIPTVQLPKKATSVAPVVTEDATPETTNAVVTPIEGIITEVTKKFRPIIFSFQFKTGEPTSLVAIDGVYTPRNEYEKAFLEHQVSKGNITFS